jgi:hypothetical protein
VGLPALGMQKERDGDRLSAVLADGLPNLLVDRDDLFFSASGCQIHWPDGVPVDGARHLERSPTSTKFPRVGDAKVVPPGPETGLVLQDEHLVNDQFLHITPLVMRVAGTSFPEAYSPAAFAPFVEAGTLAA